MWSVGWSNYIALSMLMLVIISCRIVDNLPCATKFTMIGTNEVQYDHGYKLGYVKDGKVGCCLFSSPEHGVLSELL